MHKNLSFKETGLYSVNAIVEQPWYFVKLLLLWIVSAIVILMPLFGGLWLIAAHSSMSLAILGPILFLLLIFLMLIALFLALIYMWAVPIKLLLHFYDTGSTKISFGDFFRLFSLSQFFRILGVCLLYLSTICLGLIFFVIPGIYLAIKLKFALCYVIDENMGVIRAFKKSYAVTTGKFWCILGLSLLEGALGYLIITTPVSYLVGVYLYRNVE